MHLPGQLPAGALQTAADRRHTRPKPCAACAHRALHSPLHTPTHWQSPIVVRDLHKKFALKRACLELVKAAFAGEADLDVYEAPVIRELCKELAERGKPNERGVDSSVALCERCTQ